MTSPPNPIPGSLRRLRFSLLTLLVAIALIAIALSWLVQPNRVVATALFEVRNEQPSLVAKDAGRPFSKEEFETLKKTQIAAAENQIRTHIGLVNPGIASLPVLGSSDDKEAWLQDHLEIEYPQDSEILSISLQRPRIADNRSRRGRRCRRGCLQKGSPRRTNASAGLPSATWSRRALEFANGD